MLALPVIGNDNATAARFRVQFLDRSAHFSGQKAAPLVISSDRLGGAASVPIKGQAQLTLVEKRQDIAPAVGLRAVHFDFQIVEARAGLKVEPNIL